MSLLRFEEVSFGFGDQRILVEADLALEPGERVCLIGRNGAGKSSTFRLITGAHEPDQGEIVRSPHLVELAFTLADHGHTHVGHVARLTEFTLTDLANGDPSLARDLQLRLQKCGLDTGMVLEGWTAPSGEVAAEALD